MNSFDPESCFMYYIRVISLLGWLSLSSPAWAGFILAFDSSDLAIVSTGGVVTKGLNLRITHDGVGSNQFSGYDLEIAPASSRVSVVEGTVANSNFTFDLGHVTFGGGSPWHLSGENSASNLTVTSGGPNLLARIFLQIDTSPGIPATIDLAPAIRSANRNGLIGDDITSEFSVSPALLSISAVPEPGTSLLVALVLGGAFCRSRMRRRAASLGKISI